MKLGKSFWLRTSPIIIVIIITVVASLEVYHKVVDEEREACWERLEIATKSTAEKIGVRLGDNLNFLEAVADSYVLTHHIEKNKEVGSYLQSVKSMTVFQSINVLLPDGKMINQKGDVVDVKGNLSYEELLEKGTHISPRMTHPGTGKEVIYCFTVIYLENGGTALLCGVIDCRGLNELFEVFTYADESQLFVIDCNDGNYIMDNWHEKLGNVYELGERKSSDGKSTVDIITPIINRETGRAVFISKTNGQVSYQYHTPMSDYNWQVCVVVQEDVVLRHANKLEELLLFVAHVEFVLLALYFMWNIGISVAAAKSEEKSRRLEMEQETNAAKAKFISNVSHDVRTPLNAIVGMLHIIRNHRDDEKIVEDSLDKIEVSTKYLTTLVNDMLEVNEIECGHLELECLPIDLRKLAEELSVMVEQRAVESNVVYHMDYTNLKNPYVLGSLIHIKRVLVNIISNAIKYTKDNGGEVYVTISDELGDDGVNYYSFEVKDDGIGMSVEFQERMYSAFAQEKISSRSKYEGYGLGLTIAERLVSKMNGDIEIQSKKNEGSTFTVIIPLKIDENVHKGSVNSILENDNANVDLSGLKILLVEDNEFNLDVAQMVLTDMGVIVTTAINGRIACEIFSESKIYEYDMILMDIMMPEMDGIEATKAIRGMDRADSAIIPIIAMTASTFKDEITRCIEAGMNEHISKPLDIDKLSREVVKYCRQYKRSRENK